MTSNPEKEQRKTAGIGLRQQVLLAALECTGGEVQKTFTLEDLLLTAWKRDPMAWGLRGHENKYPDSERMHVEVVRASVRGGLVGLGLLEKVRQRTYRLTPAGLIAATEEIAEIDPRFRAKAERTLADAVSAVLSHTVFQEWLRDSRMPKHFRDAGHFWGIAPGTPPSVIRARISEVDHTLNKAWALLEEKRTDEIAARHGRALFDRKDIERAREFQATLKARFARDLATLQAETA